MNAAFEEWLKAEYEGVPISDREVRMLRQAWQDGRKAALRHAAEVCRKEYADPCCHPLMGQAAECCAQAIECEAEGKP